MFFALIKISIVSGLCLITLTALIPANIKQKLIIFCLVLCLFIPFLANLPFSLNINKAASKDALLDAHVSTKQAENITDTTFNLSNILQTTNNAKSEKNQLRNWLTVFVFIWIFGSVIKITQLIFQFRQLYSIIHNSTKILNARFLETYRGKKINYRLSTQTLVPFLFVTPNSIEIIFPASTESWPEYKIQHIIAHELCHYQRKDHWSLWIANLATSVFWFHPFVHKLSQLNNQFIELACDQQLLLNGINPSLYAKTILSIPQNNRTDATVPYMSTKQSLLKIRIHEIVKPQTFKKSIPRFFLLLTLILFLFMTACVNNSALLSPDKFIKYISNDLPSFRSGTLANGHMHIATFYDGLDSNNTFLDLELSHINSNQTSWLTLGPLKKFNQQIQTWEYKTINNGFLTGNYKIRGTVADGYVDGVAIGVIYTNNQGQLSIHKSSGPIDDGYPNLICSWPLSLDDKKLIAYSPQLSANNIETLNRLLCGAQLVKDGLYSLN